MGACYRLYAAHCLEIAQRLSDRAGKIALLYMAETWIALADQIEKAEGRSAPCNRKPQTPREGFKG